MTFLTTLNETGVKYQILLAAFKYLSMRLVGSGYVQLKDAAISREIIVKGGSIKAITPFYLDDHLQRILGAYTYGRDRVISEDLNRKYFEFRPVSIYRLKNAFLLDGSVYSAGCRYTVRSTNDKKKIGFSMPGPARHFDSAVLASTCAGSTWWGHWVADELPMQMLGQNYGQLVAFNRPLYRDEPIYRENLNLQPLITAGVAHFSELVVIDEFAQNPDKTKRYNRIRSILRKWPKGKTRVFLSRGDTGMRRLLVNETEIKERLIKLGFEIVDISIQSADQVIAACRGAELVIGVEGSHMAPLLYLIEDYGTMVILYPPDLVHTANADIGVFCTLSTAMFICEPYSSGLPGEFFADPEELCRFIDVAAEYGYRNRPRLHRFVDDVLSMGG